MKTNTWFHVTSGSSELRIPDVFEPELQPHDYIVRVEGTGNSTLRITGAIPTFQFKRAVQFRAFSLTSACQTLGRVIDRLKEREEYNSHYRDFLCGSLSEVEFEKVADQFAYAPAIANPFELAPQIAALLKYTSHEFSTTEVADLLKAREEDVDEAINLQLPLVFATSRDLTTA